MLLQAGQWVGKGSLLVEGQSLGQGISCDVEVSHHDVEFNLGVEFDIKELGRARHVRAHRGQRGRHLQRQRAHPCG